MFFVGWLIMLGRGGPLSLQELCFQYVEAALLRNTLVSDVFCGLAHHVGKRWPSFIARAVLSVRRSRTIATHSGFRGFLWVGSSCWEEVALFHCKSCAFSRSKPHYCQTPWFQRCFGSRWSEKVSFYRYLGGFINWGVVWGFGCGFGWGVRGCCALCFWFRQTPSRPSLWFYKAFSRNLGQASVA